MNRRSLIVLCLLLAVPAALRADDGVLYPRAATPAAVPAAVGGRSDGPGWGSLALAAVCAVAGGWMFWRQRRSVGALGTRTARKLSVVETKPLGNRQHLVVADYDGRKFLLGVCPGRIDLLSPLDGDQPASDS